MSTKRTHKAALVAKPTSESAAAVPVTAAMPLAAPRTRPLTPMQTLLCDEAADLIVHGGHPEEVNNLLRAVIGNFTRRSFATIWPDGERDPEVQKSVDARIDRFTDELSIEWRRNCRATPEERVEPKTAADRIRTGVIDELREHFELFVVDGSPEEHWIMREMLIFHHSGENGRERFGELPLAKLMHEQTQGITRNFVRVPEHFRKQVDAYIETLRAEEAAAVTESQEEKPEAA